MTQHLNRDSLKGLHGLLLLFIGTLFFSDAGEAKPQKPAQPTIEIEIPDRHSRLRLMPRRIEYRGAEVANSYVIERQDLCYASAFDEMDQFLRTRIARRLPLSTEALKIIAKQPQESPSVIKITIANKTEYFLTTSSFGKLLSRLPNLLGFEQFRMEQRCYSRK